MVEGSNDIPDNDIFDDDDASVCLAYLRFEVNIAQQEMEKHKCAEILLKRKIKYFQSRINELKGGSQ